MPASSARWMARTPPSSSRVSYQPANAMAPSAIAPTRTSPWPSLRVSIMVPPLLGRPYTPGEREATATKQRCFSSLPENRVLGDELGARAGQIGDEAARDAGGP